LAVPPGHCKHWVVEMEYVPAAHGVQDAAPDAGAMVPAAQAVQLDAPFDANVPAAHGVQLVWPDKAT
jgi:hypothetical protein